MPRVAAKLLPTASGGFVARKVIPFDVRAEYAKLFGQRIEERFNSGPMHVGLARARHREWMSEIEARIANIRAERRGDGRTLTPKEARGLAGEWYHWYVAKMATARWPADVWEEYAHRVCDELQHEAGPGSGDVFDLIDKNEALRSRVRPLVADEAKSSQFLAAKRLALNEASRVLFLDYLIRDFFAAVSLLARRARGDHGKDKYAEQFPQYQGTADATLTPWALFEKWVEAAKPAKTTVKRWRIIFAKLEADFPNTPAGALLPEQMQAWAQGLINGERSAATVRDTWIGALRTVFAWAVNDAKLVGRNPFVGWRITVPKKIRTRETKAAYTGARMGEICQLRGTDVAERDGIWSIKITPEAGSTKTGTARVVPIHAHLVEQGFLDFVKASGKGPLFHREPPKQVLAREATNPGKSRAEKTREHLAAWVRKIGVADPELQPNHAWRHSFKAIGFRGAISEKVLDAICGHAQATVGRGYGEPTLRDKADALRRFPLYSVR